MYSTRKCNIFVMSPDFYLNIQIKLRKMGYRRKQVLVQVIVLKLD